MPLDSGDESGDLLLELSPTQDERRQRTMARIQRAQQDGGPPRRVDRSDSADVAVRIDSEDGAPLSSSSFELPSGLSFRPRPQQVETEENTLLDLTGLAQRALAAQPDEGEEGSRTSVEAAAPPKPGRATPAAGVSPALEQDLAPGPSPNNRGQVAPIRKVLVECGLCGFHVQIPVEFFGKTIHCPSCQGNAIFTESTLDPIKDEILDRLALETAERRAIYAGEQEPSPVKDLLKSGALKSFLVGVGLGLLVLFGMWSVLRIRRAQTHRAFIERAEAEGWRYACNPGETLFHQPWCRQLDRQYPGERITQEELERRGAELHECD
ncbi:MAG: hypothetical protein AB7N76_09930 [Planctomycetota bacterium]